VSGDAVHQPTWPLLLKIEHIVKLQVLGNNSKTVNNIKNDQNSKIYIPCKGNNSKMGNRIYFKIAGWVDLDMLHIFAI
jgi:hypothetical protein